ncbi:Wzz/FepE/Etk N-terminal domain-containing protein [Marinobacterium marinum]|uniref:Chain-length determining protein n=1 Tax=Marinobacterium marinum TaxID=2756129 RepID=A0A7W1WWT8_9GAMM|nr:Wzz/FepE/Etk N-terminal domain-containing protein [Marinobacterium marinum]MBA4501501.1 hypothetical protein [Marinobacterium marinum]
MQHNTPTQPAFHHDDEIDLFELVANIWKQKWLVVIVTAITLFLGGAYAFLSTPTYQASAQLEIPLDSSLKDLQSLHNFKGLDTNTLFKTYLQSLSSNDVKTRFIGQAPDAFKADLGQDPDPQKQLEGFNERLSLGIPKRDDKSAYELDTPVISLTASSATAATSALNAYLDQANRYLHDKLQDDYNASRASTLRLLDERIELLTKTEAMKREAQITQLEEQHQLQVEQVEDQLKARRYQYNQTLNDRVQRLQEALKIATQLDIKRPSTLSQQGRQAGSPRVEINADIRSNQDPLYLRGTDFLNAELTQLQARPETFIEDGRIRELEAKLVELETNREIEILKARTDDAEFSQKIQDLKAEQVDIMTEQFPDNLQLAFTNGPVVASPDPIKPKKALILALSIVLGGMLGVMIALIRAAVRNRNASSKA